MSRLQTIARDALPPAQRRFHDAVRAVRRRPLSGPFIVLMNSSPDLAARFAHLGHYFHARGQADESELAMHVRGFVAVVGARALNGVYEWSAWVNWALDAGVAQATADAYREGRAPAALTPEEALVADFCTQLVSGNHRLGDATFKAALERFGARGVVELAVTLGYFAMIALPLNAFEMTMSPEQSSQRRPFVPLPVLGECWRESDAARTPLPPLEGVAAGPRLALLTEHAQLAPPEQHFIDRVILSRGWISPLFATLMHSPDVAARVAHIGAWFLWETALPPAARALAWLVTARELDCAYAWPTALAAAREAGVDAQAVAAIAAGRLPALPAAEATLVRFCLQLLRGNHHVDEATYRATVDAWGTALAIEIAAHLGYFAMTGLIANAFELAPPAGDAQPAL